MVDDTSADFVTILSSDMIADIVQVYFDKELYTRKKVKIVDLKPQGDGYAFSLSFVQVPIVAGVTPKTAELIKQTVNNVSIEQWTNEVDRDYRNGTRDSKGRFTKAVS